MFVAVSGSPSATNSAGASPTGRLRVRLRDSRTGAAIPDGHLMSSSEVGSRIAATSTDVTGTGFLQQPSGKVLLTATSPTHHPLETHFDLDPDTELSATVWLDPVEEPVELRQESVQSRSRAGTVLVHGYAVDSETGFPLADVAVQLTGLDSEARTNAAGYFWFLTKLRPRISIDELPQTDDLIAESRGYKTYLLEDLFLCGDAVQLLIEMEKGNGRTLRQNTHRLFADTAAQPSAAAQSEDRTPSEPVARHPSASSVSPPASIRVGTGCTIGAPLSCPQVDIYTLEDYVGYGLGHEWSPNWTNDSLMAGAVAYRSYGAYRVFHPMTTNYDICDSRDCQTFAHVTWRNVQTAAAETLGVMVVNGANTEPFFTEYALEQNDGASCGDQKLGRPSQNWNCISDSVCKGQSFNGHGRGMCQNGTQRWSLSGLGWEWIVNHYYNDNGNPSGARSGVLQFPCSPTCGNITILATLDGSPWSGSLSYRLDGTSQRSGTFTPATYYSTPAGGYTAYYISGGPAGAAGPSIDPPASLNLLSGGTIAWTFRFTSQNRCSASVIGTKRAVSAATCPQCYAVTTFSSPMGSGQVALNTPASCVGGYVAGTAVSLTELPNSGYQFTNWTASNCALADPMSSTTVCTVNGPGDAIVTADFASLPQQGPTVSTGNATSITDATASLNGTVNPNGSQTATAFDYGATIAYGSSTSGQTYSDSTPHPISVGVSSLACGTLYHFRARAMNINGSVNGDDATFSTNACAPGLPTVGSTYVSDVTMNGVTFNSNVNPNGSDTWVNILYDNATKATPIVDIGGGNSPILVKQSVSGLACGTQYSYRIVASNAAGTYEPPNFYFTTSPCPVVAPDVTTNNASSIDQNNATLSGSVNPNGNTTSAAFDYGTSTAYGSSVIAGTLSGSTSQAISATVHGLTCDTLYHFRARASNDGGLAFGSDVTFKTQSCTTQSCDPTWTGGPSMDTFAEPNTMVIGDFDGDGKPDVAVTVYAAGVVRVFHNISTTATPQFGAPIDVQVGSSPEGMALADVDGDGLPDLIVANAGSASVTLLRNTSSPGSISFARTTIDNIDTPHQVVVADFDGDGKPDFAVTSNSAKHVTVFRNRSTVGTVTFEQAVVIAAAGYLAPIAAGDFDGDGKPDLIVPVQDNNAIYAFRNTTAGSAISFAAAGSWSTGSNPVSVAAADLDHDGKTDVVVANAGSNTLSIFRNNGSPGNIGFEPPIAIATGANPMGLSVADLDNDGRPDIVVGNNGADTVMVFRNLSKAGTISLAAASTVSVGASPMTTAIGDLDLDGLPDIAVAKTGANSIATRLSRPMTPSALPIGTVGQPYPTTTFAQSGTTVTLQSGSPPTGMTFSGATLSGTPMASGTFSLTVSAITPGGCPNTRLYTLLIRGTAPAFTDDPLIPRVTKVKAIHFTELRDVINGMRAASGLGNFGFSGNVAAGYPVTATDVQDLRSALGQARAALGFTPMVWGNLLIPGVTLIRASDIEELRAGVK
jgi:hypothetical protein